jgi:hypothetical protein
MTTFEIILVVVLAVWLIHYIWWGIRVSKASKWDADCMKNLQQTFHPEGMPHGAWPPDGVPFP